MSFKYSWSFVQLTLRVIYAIIKHNNDVLLLFTCVHKSSELESRRDGEQLTSSYVNVII